MRISVLILVLGVVSSAGPARAQTYDPASPVCMQIGEWGGWRIECGYASMAQCAASASGRGANCFPNPYFSGGRRGRIYLRRRARG
jgi:uncharacterized protein DUF3551